MEKTKRKSKDFVKLVFNLYTLIALLIITIGISTYFYFDIKNNNKELKIQINKTKPELQSLLTNKEIKNKKLNELNKELEDLNNLDNSIENIKKEFFDNAKKYESLVLSGGGTKKIAYLTFDDGPYQLTNKFLDILDEYDILATFFVIGNKPDDRLPIYKEEASRGHTIGNHTYYHSISQGLYSSVNSFINQIKKNEEFLYEQTGIKTNIMRFPGGSSQAKKLKNGIVSELANMGYGYVDWDLETGDGKSVAPTKTESINNVLNKTAGKNVAVVLMHDYSNVTYETLPSIIEGLTEQNYIMLPLFYESSKVKKN